MKTYLLALALTLLGGAATAQVGLMGNVTYDLTAGGQHAGTFHTGDLGDSGDYTDDPATLHDPDTDLSTNKDDGNHYNGVRIVMGTARNCRFNFGGDGTYSYQEKIGGVWQTLETGTYALQNP